MTMQQCDVGDVEARLRHLESKLARATEHVERRIDRINLTMQKLGNRIARLEAKVERDLARAELELELLG
jgi:hypothetical protein